MVILHLVVLVLSAMHFDEEQLISEYLSETRQQKVVEVYNSVHSFDSNSHYVTSEVRHFTQTARS